MIVKFSGRVVEGKHIGHTLGFPTANIEPDTHIDLPENGVYAAKVTIDNNTYMSVLNQGKHPTLPEGKPAIEAHIINFDNDVYGKRVTVEYVKFLRYEKKFASVDELISQIHSDIESAVAVLP